jgi:hypothetical protein
MDVFKKIVNDIFEEIKDVEKPLEGNDLLDFVINRVYLKKNHLLQKYKPFMKHYI